MIAVTVYSKPNCQACNLTKSQVRAAALELDLSSAPIVCANVGGVEQFWSGFRPDRISALIGAAA